MQKYPQRGNVLLRRHKNLNIAIYRSVATPITLPETGSNFNHTMDNDTAQIDGNIILVRVCTCSTE